MIPEAVENTVPHLGRKQILGGISGALPELMPPPLKVNKHNIRMPPPTANPPQAPGSPSALNITQPSAPIDHNLRNNTSFLRGLLDSANGENHESKGKPTEVLPWETQRSDNSDNESLFDLAPWGSGGKYVAQAFPSAKDKSLPAVTISPMDQASLYAWVECTMVQACSDFLRAQQLNLNIALLGKEVKKWEAQKIRLSTGETRRRDKVIEFMFGMEIQCKLIEGNMKKLHFSGPGALNPANIISAWKAIIPSLSPRTYCTPDYLILEHFRVFEKVLGLFGPVYYDAEKFESRRSGLVQLIMKSGDIEKHLLHMKNLASLREEREKAEGELLKEVGLLTMGKEER